MHLHFLHSAVAGSVVYVRVIWPKLTGEGGHRIYMEYTNVRV